MNVNFHIILIVMFFIYYHTFPLIIYTSFLFLFYDFRIIFCLTSQCLLCSWQQVWHVTGPMLVESGEFNQSSPLHCCYLSRLGLPMLNLLSSKVQGGKDFWKPAKPLSCWYSLDSSHLVHSDEYPYAWISIIL